MRKANLRRAKLMIALQKSVELRKAELRRAEMKKG